MTNYAPPFNAQERDIDIMLIEEMHCNSTFISWIASRVEIETATLVSAQHSVYKGNGETDVLAIVDTPNGRIALMIEDKIGAAMQPRQAERYHERGKQLCAAEPATVGYKTVLCAPRSYLSSISLQYWDAKLPFEDIADWFAKQNNPRSDWRRNVLLDAIKRQRRSAAGASENNVTTDLALVKFKQEYRNYIIENYPEFHSSEQSGRDKELYFAEQSFPAYIIFKHRLLHSQMVIIFEKQWRELALNILPNKIPEETMWITHHPSALHLVMGVEPIDLTEPFADQTDLADVAMKAARRLLSYALMVQQRSPLAAVSRDLREPRA